MNVPHLQPEHTGIAAQLRLRSLAVPIYQRPFSWREEQISEYWQDLSSAFARPSREYFLGTLVITRKAEGPRDAIIDGQQRLATTALLLAAVRDVYKSRADDKRAQMVQTQFLSTSDLKSGAEIPRLTLSSDDDSYFRKVVLEGTLDPPTRTSQKLIRAASEYFNAEIEKVALSSGANWAERLAEWVSFLDEGVRVIALIVPSDADAFLIFETLNDRGADLTVADLLKNYLFGRAGTRLDLVRDRWVASLSALEITSENALFTTFLRHWWGSKYGPVRERELYRDIRDRVTSEVHAAEFAEELEASARKYAALLNSEHEYWASFGTGTKENLETLFRFELEQNRPLLLAAMQHFSPAEIKKLLRNLVCWAVRGLIVGGIGGGTYEKAYAAAAVRIRKGEIQTTEQIFAALGTLVPTDNEFETAFGIAKVPKSNIARYYLIALERKLSGGAEPELVPNANEEEVNLEHVLPKNATEADWGGTFSADERKDLLYRIGNLVLLSKGPNGRIGNKPFSAKAPILASSQLALTKEVGAESTWRPMDVIARQERLAKIAVTVWPRSQ